MTIYDQHVSPGIRKTMDYIRGPGHDNTPDRAKLIGGQGFGFDPKNEEDVKLAIDMMEHNAKQKMQASQTKKCENDALHISISWPRGSRADQDEMHEAAKAFLKELGMEKAMALFYKHSDKKHPHMHMGASVIDPKTGLTYDQYHFVYRGQHQAIKWERIKNEIPDARRPQHDIADAAEKRDYDRLHNLLKKDGEKISHKKIDHALAMGGHFGKDMAAQREAFKKYIKDEPTREKGKEQEPADRWWQEPVGPGQARKPFSEAKEQPVSNDKELLRNGMKDADPKHREFVQRLQRSHDQFGGLTPHMRAALQNRPDQPEPSRFAKVKDAVSGYFRRDTEPPKPEPKQPEQRVTTSQAPRESKEQEVAPSRAPGTGNTPDRTDQTAEGRAHIKRQKSNGRDR